MAKTLSRSQQPKALRALRLTIIGTGKMGQAILKGLLASGVPKRHIVGVEASSEMRAHVSRRFGIRVTDALGPGVKDATVVLLAVKPQQMAQVAAELRPLLSSKQLVISIAAGITLQWLASRLGARALIRVMPNLPATIGAGFSAIASGRKATPAHRRMAQALFGVVGETVVLDERLFDAVTAVSGSGPAYVFYLVRAWQEAAQALGLPEKVAQRAVRSTLEGSVRLLAQEKATPDELIAHVASKGGTTEAALAVLARESVQKHFVDALRAAADRSKQLRS